jgi:hypothetical protein
MNTEQLLSDYVVQEGTETGVSRRMTAIAVFPGVVFGSLGSVVHPAFYIGILLHVVVGAYIYHRMYERGWAIYSGSFWHWGKRTGTEHKKERGL